MEKKRAIELSDVARDMSFKLKYGDYMPHLAGSSSDKNQEYYGDYDFFCLVKKPTTVEEAFTNIFNIINRIKKDRDFYFIELKVQLVNGVKIRFNNSNLSDLVKLKVAKMKDIDFIKIDFVTREVHQFIDISCIYKFIEPDTIEDEADDLDIEPLKEDMDKYLKEGDIYKALKREYSINNITGNTERNNELLKLFNSKYGKMYKMRNTLGAILHVLQAGYNDKGTINKIEHNLTEDNIKTPLNKIKSYIKKLEGITNNEAKKYMVKK